MLHSHSNVNLLLPVGEFCGQTFAGTDIPDYQRRWVRGGNLGIRERKEPQKTM
jgi:hypothetical protein